MVEQPQVVNTKTFEMPGNRFGEMLDFVINEPEDGGDVSFSLDGHDLPDWLADTIWGLVLGLNDPVWIRLLVHWARYSGHMNSSYLGSHNMTREIMDYLRDGYSVDDAADGAVDSNHL